MLKRHLSLVLISLCIFSAGCATIFNGTSQNVPVRMPIGTVVRDGDSIIAPIRLAPHGDTVTYLHLARNSDHTLSFAHGGKTVSCVLRNDLEGAWIAFDFPLIIPIIVDLADGAWNRFEGVATYFPTDSSFSSAIGAHCQLFTPTRSESTKLGVNLELSLERSFPSSVFFILPNGFAFSVGYPLADRLSGYFTFGQESPDLLLPPTSQYTEPLENFVTVTADARYMLNEEFYLSAGAGETTMSTDTLHRQLVNTTATVSSPGFSATIGEGFLGIGVAGRSGFIELRERFGFSAIVFPNGERGMLRTTTVRAGVKVEF